VDGGSRAALAYLIGTDEAGYGPNLGPLVVAATLWRLDDDLLQADLYRHLAPIVVGSGEGRAACAKAARSVIWADSKEVYSTAVGIGTLERGVLAALASLGQAPDDWRELWACLAPGPSAELDAAPWMSGFFQRLPLAADRGEIDELGRSLRHAFQSKGIRLVGIHGRAVFPSEFNDLVRHCGNKATALSEVTLELAARIVAGLPPAPIRLLCDKHGGRNRYAALLHRFFDDSLVEVQRETRGESSYRIRLAAGIVEARFQCRGESALPIALASMCAKYLRELAMRAFNDYWRRRVPGLVPTAGYPADARRFKKAIAAAQAELGIPDAALWRHR
jgi:ribonuclease HII